MTKASKIRRIISMILIVGVVGCSFGLISESSKQKEYGEDFAEIQNIKYGLLNVTKWKEKIADIVVKKVEGFKLTTGNKDFLRVNIESILNSYLDTLLVELRGDVNSETDLLPWIGAGLKSFAAEAAVDLFGVKKQIPKFTDAIIEQIESNETTANLKAFIIQQFNDQAQGTSGLASYELYNSILAKYNSTSSGECAQEISTQMKRVNQRMNLYTLIILGSAIMVLFLLLFRVGNVPRIDFLLLSIITLVLLTIAVITPMMEIDVRIDKFSFLLMGEKVEFNDQILFYKSKSIFEVVRLLFLSMTLQSIIVGILILLFSIVFPVLKIVSTLVVAFNQKMATNKFIHFFAFKSGKWSMADVFVVAMFMSFLGLEGVISSQLEDLELHSEAMGIITANHSVFGVGFLFFVAFTIMGIIVSTKLSKNQNTK